MIYRRLCDVYSCVITQVKSNICFRLYIQPRNNLLSHRLPLECDLHYWRFSLLLVIYYVILIYTPGVAKSSTPMVLYYMYGLVFLWRRILTAWEFKFRAELWVMISTFLYYVVGISLHILLKYMSANEVVKLFKTPSTVTDYKHTL